MVEFTQQTAIPEEAKIGCLSVVQRHMKRHQERLRENLRSEQASLPFLLKDFEAVVGGADLTAGGSRSPSARFGY